MVFLSLLFSGQGSSLESRFVLFGGFGLLCIVAAVLVVAGGCVERISSVLVQLQDTTAQIRIRRTFLMLLLLSIVAQARNAICDRTFPQHEFTLRPVRWGVDSVL